MSYSEIVKRFPIGQLVMNFGCTAKVTGYMDCGDHWLLKVKGYGIRYAGEKWPANPEMCEPISEYVTEVIYAPSNSLLCWN